MNKITINYCERMKNVSSRENMNKTCVNRKMATIYGSNGFQFVAKRRQLSPIMQSIPRSPRGTTNDLYSIQKTHSKPKQPQKSSQVFRKTFSIQKKETLVSISKDNSKKIVNVLSNTMTNFRPPSTSMRRCVQEQQNNFLSRYQIVKQLGKGTFGLVYLAKQKQTQIKSFTDSFILPPYKNDLDQQTNISINRSAQVNESSSSKPQYYAIKVYEKFKMNKDPTKFKNIRKEINIMQNIEHPNIIKLHESVDTLTKISLVVQYGGDSSLLQYLKMHYPLTQEAMRKICRQILSAIVYLHEKNIVHRDIKLQNVLMLEEQAKLIDFGFSTLTYKGRKLNAICGTPNYMAPEVLSKKEYIGQAADIWSFGVVAYTLGEGRHPFKADSYNELERLANRGNIQFKRITNMVHQSFIKRILKTRAQDRPKASDLLLHPWFSLTE